MRFLIYVDGTPLSEQAVRYAGWLAGGAGAAVTLLTSTRAARSPAELRAVLDRAQAALPAPAEELVRANRGVHAMLAEVSTGNYTLLVAASRGRRGWQRLAFGSLASRLARYSPIPVLIVKGPARAGLRRVLACTAGGKLGERVARWGGQVAHWMDAELTVLHVMSQLALSFEAPAEQLVETAEEAIAAQTREGLHLVRELELAQAQVPMGELEARPKLRHGLVVDEVVAEAGEGNYDLVVIGGHQAPAASVGFDRMRAHLLEDVADQIVMSLQRPVLVVKGE